MAQLANLTVSIAAESANFVTGIEQSRGAVQRLLKQLDPAAAATVKFKKELDLLERGLKDGVLTNDLYTQSVERLTERYGANVSGASKVVGQNGLMRAGMQQLGYQLGDMSQGFAMGTSAVTIFAQQSGQTIQALQLMTGESKGVLAVLGGPWGAILAAALVAVTPFVAKLFEGGDALRKETDKLKENADKTALADEAKRAFAKTEAGAVDDIRSLTEELKKQNDELRTNAELQNIRAKSDLDTQRKALQDAMSRLADAQRDLANTPMGGNGAEPGAISATYRAAEARVAKIKADIAGIQNDLADAQAAYIQTRASLADEAAKRAIDPIAQIKRVYEGPDGLIEQAKRRAVAEGTVTAELTRQIIALRQREQAEITAEEKRQAATRQAANDNRQTGRQISLPEAEAIVKSIGGTITSATRTFTQQAALYAKYLAGTGSLAAKPGHSDHELGNALDIAKTPGMSLAKIREAFTEAGVSIKQLLDEGNHFHVAWTADSKAAAEASRNEAAAIKLIRDASAGAYKAVAGLEKDQHKQLTDLFKDDAKAWDDIAKKASTAFNAGQDQRLFDEHELQRVREDNIRDLAGLYSDLFTGGTKRLWQDFERWGFDVISELLAKWTVGAAAGDSGGSGLGGLLGGLGKILGLGGGASLDVGAINAGTNAALDAGLPGLAAGGDIQFGGKGGIDQNILSLNGSPIAKVSRGETASIRNGGSNDNRPIVIHIVGEEGAAFVPRVAAISGATSAQSIQIAQKSQMKRADRRLGR